MIKRFLILICASVILFGGAGVAAAQDSTSTDPLADAARKAQAQKKTEPKPTKVYTDDNIGAVQGQVSVVGQTPAGSTATSSSGDQSGDKQKSSGEKRDEAYYRKKFGELDRKLADDEKELDVLQREYSLKQQQYYSDPNTAMKEEYTRQDLTDTSNAIDKKKQDIADDNQAISDAEDDLRRNGGDPGWERADTAPSSASSSSSPSTPPSPSADEPPAGSQPGQPGEVVAPSDTSTPPPTPEPEPSTAPSTPPSR
jgi:hypothetical protein